MKISWKIKLMNRTIFKLVMIFFAFPLWNKRRRIITQSLQPFMWCHIVPYSISLMRCDVIMKLFQISMDSHTLFPHMFKLSHRQTKFNERRVRNTNLCNKFAGCHLNYGCRKKKIWIQRKTPLNCGITLKEVNSMNWFILYNQFKSKFIPFWWILPCRLVLVEFKKNPTNEMRWW